ncbi:MAG: amino acid ABC transporter permease [Anaerolineae bacterium]|nr:amino acid ABC transporter permease [Anaerolineae bacterium]MDK1080686.1 amino acid ABC transporter permease [Anaerolineae bacterium]
MAINPDIRRQRPGLAPWVGDLSRFPWWILVVLLIGIAVTYAIIDNRFWGEAYDFVKLGIKITVKVSLISFTVALSLGLLAGLGGLSSNMIYRNFSMLYVQVIRGIPIIVQLYFVAFVIAPTVVSQINNLGDWMLASGILVNLGSGLANLHIRDVPMINRAIASLAIAYGAFEAEVFRAGIQSIERGQTEAARSLGMSHFQSMRYIILPQAIRVVMPPLGNDFISILKDSSLVSILAVRELTHMGQLHRARTFRSWEALGTVAVLYLMLTLTLAFLVKSMERRLAFEK